MSQTSARTSPATMRDVALLAGVSVKTVSRVVNAEPWVSAEVRTRVEGAIGKLGYRPNPSASNLRRTNARTGIIGALLQDVSNSFSASLLRSLEDAAREHDTAVLAASLDEEPDRERTVVASVLRRRVDGLCMMPATDRQEYLADDISRGLPVVCVDRRAHGIDVDSVTVDNELGGRLATEHLLSGGHRRIAFLSDLAHLETAAERHRGFLKAMTTAGLKVPPKHVVTGLRSASAAQAALTGLLQTSNPPTAVFTARNVLSVGAVRALRATGRTGHVAIAGFDDFPLADIIDPPLTVVRQDVRRVGQEAARILFERVDGDTSPPRHLVIEPTLVVRGSGEVPGPHR